MKSVIKLIVAGVVFYAAYIITEPYISEWRGPADTEAEVNREEETTRSLRKQITCPTCDGEGRLSYIDRRGDNHIYPCRMCNVTGCNQVTLLVGAHICPDCKGMGRNELREHRANVLRPRDGRGGYLITAARCQRCNATGVILPRTPPGSQRPSPSR